MRRLRRLALCIAILSAPAAANATATVFEGATVIDGTGAAPIPNAVVVVRDGRIAAVGARSAVQIPAEATRIDVTGKTIMPGLINAHGHVRLNNRSTAPARTQLLDQLALYARYGVTTVYSLGDDGIESVKLRDELRNAPSGAGPVVSRFFVSGPSLRPVDPDQARAVVIQNAARGVDITKTRLEEMPPGPGAAALFEPLIAQSHAASLPVAVHVVDAEAARAVIDAGADIIAHSIRDRDPDAALIAAMKARNVGYIPTLTRDLSVFIYESTPDFAADPFFAREPAYRATLAALTTPEAQARYRASANAQRTKALLAQARRSLKVLSDAGVPIAMGTDSGAGAGRWQGYFEHLEMEMMVDSGLSPLQVITAATGDAARVMRIDPAAGTLRPGHHADLLVLAHNPLDDIRHTRSLEQVWIGGRRVE